MSEAENIYVSAVMPCLNEERTIGICVEKALRCFSMLGIEGEVVVADNGSTDRSVQVAESFGARVVRETRKGYGAALSAGVFAARGQVVVMADADDTYDWLTLGDFVEKIEEGYDLVVGNRFLGGIDPGAMPALHRYIGNPVLSGLARLFYRIPIGDFHCGMRAFTRAAFDQMSPSTPGMEFATEMVVSASQSGLRIGEIPTRLHPDQRDRPPHLRSFRDGWRHLRFMLTFAPDYLFLLPGFVLLILGLSGMTLLLGGTASLGSVRFGIHYLALSSMLTLCGANAISFGVLAKVFAARSYPLLPSSTLKRLLRLFSLERGLLFGLALVVTGLAGDAFILWQWNMRSGGAMEDTINLAFVCNTLIVLGVNIMFGAFILNMILGTNPPIESISEPGGNTTDHIGLT